MAAEHGKPLTNQPNLLKNGYPQNKALSWYPFGVGLKASQKGRHPAFGPGLTHIHTYDMGIVYGFTPEVLKMMNRPPFGTRNSKGHPNKSNDFRRLLCGELPYDLNQKKPDPVSFTANGPSCQKAHTHTHPLHLDSSRLFLEDFGSPGVKLPHGSLEVPGSRSLNRRVGMKCTMGKSWLLDQYASCCVTHSWRGRRAMVPPGTNQGVEGGASP